MACAFEPSSGTAPYEDNLIELQWLTRNDRRSFRVTRRDFNGARTGRSPCMRSCGHVEI